MERARPPPFNACLAAHGRVCCIRPPDLVRLPPPGGVMRRATEHPAGWLSSYIQSDILKE